MAFKFLHLIALRDIVSAFCCCQIKRKSRVVNYLLSNQIAGFKVSQNIKNCTVIILWPKYLDNIVLGVLSIAPKLGPANNRLHSVLKLP